MEAVDVAERWRGKAILAPMVRCGTLPLRLQALEYGADLVYSEEIVDFKAPLMKRVVNEEDGTVDFFSKGGRAVYRTCPREAGRNVVQLGSSSATRVLACATHFARDVSGFDVNMGCPKRFSMHAGMGAALLSKVEVAADIVKTLRRNFNLPISCKIRLLEDVPHTVDFMRAMEAAGAQAIGLHTRHITERPREPAHWETLETLGTCVKVPVIANGDVFSVKDIDRALSTPGVSACMLARGALKNVSVFRREPTPLPLRDVIAEYVRICIDTNAFWTTTKYTVQQMYRYNDLGGCADAFAVQRIKSIEDLARHFGVDGHKKDARRVQAAAAKHTVTITAAAAPAVTKTPTEAALPLNVAPDATAGAGAGAGAGAACDADGVAHTSKEASAAASNKRPRPVAAAVGDSAEASSGGANPSTSGHAGVATTMHSDGACVPAAGDAASNAGATGSGAPSSVEDLRSAKRARTANVADAANGVHDA